MPRFSYKAKQGPAQLVEGIVEADNLDSAVVKVMHLGLTPVDVQEAAKVVKKTSHKSLKTSFKFYKKVKVSELSMFTRQAGDLVGAGVPLLRTLNLIHNQTKNKIFQEIINRMQLFVRDGGRLSDALAQHPDVFSRLYVNMVRSGEGTGNLDVVLGRLADFIEKDLETHNKITASLAYPLFILIIGMLSMFALLTFVVPRLSAMFEDMGETLPVPTMILINVSHFFAQFWWLIVLIVTFAIIYSRKVLETSKGRLRLDAFKLKLPVLGELIKNVEIGRFARTLGTLMQNGVVIVPALNSVWGVLENEVLKEEIKGVAEEVSKGSSLTLALKNSAYFPPMAINMITVGEETGKLEQGLYKLADVYERESEQMVKMLISLLGPMALVFIVLTVGFMVMAMLLPIFKMNLIIK